MLAPDVELAHAAFSPLAGHLNRFCSGLIVNGFTADGRRVRGRLVAEGWHGTLTYAFGSRRLVGQWLVAIDPGPRAGRPGQSGMPWLSLDGVAVGIQVGVLRRADPCVIVTPMQTVCELFRVGVAG